MNKKRSKEDWQQLVEEYNNSGLSLTNWCKEKNISKSTIYPYVKKYSKGNVEITSQQWGTIDISDKSKR